MQQTTYFFVSLSKLNRNCISFKDGDETRGEDRIERKFRGELIKVGCHWREGKWRGDVCAATYARRESDQGCEMCGAGSGSEPRDTGPARAANNRFIHNETMTRLQAY